MDYEKCPYRQFLEILKTEFGEFLRLAEMGKTIRHASLKSRKQSILLRNMLKTFRTISIKNDKEITEIIRGAKQSIKKINS